MSRYFRAGSGRSRARARHSLAVTFAAALLQLPAGIAAAQDTAGTADAPTSSGATKLDAVMVKGQAQGYVSDEARAATKTDTPLVETPQSISVVTREQLDAQQVVSLSEALRYTAGVNTQPYGSDNRYNWYSIRGFSANDYTFQDGLRLVSGYFMQPAPDPYGFESVEIVRGPSSVLYGQGSPGGLVNIDSKLPTQTRTGNAGLMFGNYDLREAYADSAGPITDDGRLSYRLTALGKLSDTQVEGAGNNRLLIAPALTWKPFDGTRITFLGNYQDDDTSG
ncbi:MAG: TonB-dependent siderophore receptor, partial [Nevskiales bacterium]